MTQESAIDFVRRAAKLGGRIVCTGDLLDIQIAHARVNNTMWVDPDSAIGYVILPWNLSTVQDKEREARLLGVPFCGESGEKSEVKSS